MPIVNKQLHKISAHTQAGVGLIDVMIAVVVFSFGLLAVASLQTITKQSNFEAIQRTNASMLAHDLLERMRLNNLEQPSGGQIKSSLAYYVPDSSDAVVLAYGDNLTAPTPNCNTGSCATAAELAAWDLYEFQLMLRGRTEKSASDASVGGLLNPTVCLTASGTDVDDGGPGTYTVTIAWKGQAYLPLSAAPSNTCGENLYDSDAGDYAYRRIFELTSFMGCPEPNGCKDVLITPPGT
jgi:type IV pilus assembly protein PilV